MYENNIDITHSKKGCNGCGGCASKKNKPKDCKGDGCGRCCGGRCKHKNQTQEQLILTLLERYYLPFLYIKAIEGNIYIYKDNADTSYAKIRDYQESIKNCEQLGYITLDYDIPLDEYSYQDYSAFNIADYLQDENYNSKVKLGSIAITDKCLHTFLPQRTQGYL